MINKPISVLQQELEKLLIERNSTIGDIREEETIAKKIQDKKRDISITKMTNYFKIRALD